MKKNFLLLIALLTCQQIFSQLYPATIAEYNLSPAESQVLLRLIPGYLKTIKSLPASERFSNNENSFGTNGKVLANGKFCSVAVDYQTTTGDRGTESNITFYIRDNNPEYFPMETVCFHYDTKHGVGTILKCVRKNLNDRGIYEKDPAKLKARFKELTNQINDFF